jgi:hypothetical protein
MLLVRHIGDCGRELCRMASQTGGVGHFSFDGKTALRSAPLLIDAPKCAQLAFTLSGVLTAAQF